jgi:hypothetical protein
MYAHTDVFLTANSLQVKNKPDDGATQYTGLFSSQVWSLTVGISFLLPVLDVQDTGVILNCVVLFKYCIKVIF